MPRHVGQEGVTTRSDVVGEVKAPGCEVKLSSSPLHPQEAFVSHATHANAPLTPRARLQMARLIVEEGWSIPRAAERFLVAYRTAKKWAD